MNLGVIFNPGAGRESLLKGIGSALCERLSSNDQLVSGAGRYGEDYLNKPCIAIGTGSMNFSRALRFLVESFRKYRADMLIGIGGDGTLNQIAFSLLDLGWKVPLMGVAAGTANVGPLLRFSPERLKLADLNRLSIEPVGAVEVLRDSNRMGYAFVDVILGQTFLGTIDGKTANLSADAFLR